MLYKSTVLQLKARRLQGGRSLVTPRAAAAEAPPLPFRVGHGFDLHRLAEGYDLIIGGKKIPHTKGCEAHSDGDVLLHCVTDAILGESFLTHKLRSTPVLHNVHILMHSIGPNAIGV